MQPFLGTMALEPVLVCSTSETDKTCPILTKNDWLDGVAYELLLMFIQCLAETIKLIKDYQGHVCTALVLPSRDALAPCAAQMPSFIV